LVVVVVQEDQAEHLAFRLAEAEAVAAVHGIKPTAVKYHTLRMAAVPQAVADILWQQAQQYQMAGVQAVRAVLGLGEVTTLAVIGDLLVMAVLAVLAVRMALPDQQADRVMLCLEIQTSHG